MKIERPVADALGTALKVGDSVLVPMYGNRLERGTIRYFTSGGLALIELGTKRTPVRRHPSNVVLASDRGKQ